MKRSVIPKLLVAALIAFTASCTEEIPELGNGTVSFSLDIENNLKSGNIMESGQEPHSIYISIKDSKQNDVCNLRELPLIKFGDQYITEQLKLDIGNYTVEDFIVVNDEDSTIYLTPKMDSEFEFLVDHPLPLSFEVSGNNTTSLVLEVIPASIGEPINYGYATFSFTIVDNPGKGLVAYYPLNGNANDLTINSFDGELYGATLTQDRFGEPDQAYYFDGDDHIKLPHDFDFPTRTVTFFFNADNISTTLGCLYDSDHHDLQYGKTGFSVWEMEGIPYLRYQYGGFSTRIEIEEDSWYMATTSVAGDSARHFLNGVKIGSVPSDTTHSKSGNNYASIGMTRTNDRYFNGTIDDFRIYNRALTEMEIEQLLKMRE